MPFAVENHSPFPHFAFVKTGPDGSDFHVLAVRATFDWVHDGEMTASAEQQPVVIADQWSGPAGEGDLRFEADLVIGKRRTDVHVIGHACAPSGEPAADFPLGIRIGELTKTLRVTGPRTWEQGVFGFRLSPPRPVSRVPLSYRVAYGGARRRTTSRGEESDVFEANPIGVGYKGRFPIEEAVWPAPQIEALDAPIRSLSDQPAPEGLGPIPRWWLPRRARCGTLTEDFVRENPGKLPGDFQWEFYNSAHPGLMVRGFLDGDEHIGTVGLFPEGRSSCRLPGVRAIAAVVLKSGRSIAAPPKLDTLTIDTDAGRVHATWRLRVPAEIGMQKLAFGFTPQARA
jgi:hypothetical protein